MRIRNLAGALAVSSALVATSLPVEAEAQQGRNGRSRGYSSRSDRYAGGYRGGYAYRGDRGKGRYYGYNRGHGYKSYGYRSHGYRPYGYAYGYKHGYKPYRYGYYPYRYAPYAYAPYGYPYYYDPYYAYGYPYAPGVHGSVVVGGPHFRIGVGF
jgi:hypothetical protein